MGEFRGPPRPNERNGAQSVGRISQSVAGQRARSPVGDPVEVVPFARADGIVLAVGYYVRAFCTKGEPSPLRPVLEYAAECGAYLALDPPVSESSLDEGSWEQVGIAYKDHKAPILFEINRGDGTDESVMREEIEEFIELLEDVRNTRNRRRVEKHLRSTRFIVAAQLPSSDIDEDGYAALGHVLTYFVNNSGAMIQADGEGFYEGGKVIVELD